MNSIRQKLSAKNVNTSFIIGVCCLIVVILSLSSVYYHEFHLSEGDHKPALPEIEPTHYIDFIHRHLFQPVGGTGFSAIAETEKPLEGDIWFWSDDNGKNLEVFALPGMLDRYPALAESILQYLMKMSPGIFIFRRTISDSIIVAGEDPADFSIHTNLLNYHGNLKEFEIKRGFRFHDSREADAAIISSSIVEFRYENKRYKFVTKEHLTSTTIEEKETEVVLNLEAILEFADKSVATVTHQYRIQANKPYLEVKVSIKSAASAPLTDVIISNALSLPAQGIRYSLLHTFADRNYFEVYDSKEFTNGVLHKGTPKWFGFYQERCIGDNYAIVTIPNNPEILRHIEADIQSGGHFAGGKHAYFLDALEPGQTKTISEKQVLLAGGLYSNWTEYDSIFDSIEDRFGATDVSISYDYGAEINGVTALYLADKQRLLKTPSTGSERVAYTDEVKSWVDEHLRAYRDNFLIKRGQDYPFLYSRGLSFVILGVDNMYRASGDEYYRELLVQLADVLLTFRTEHCFSCSGTAEFEDCSAAAIIALARAYMSTRHNRFLVEVKRGIAAFAVDTTKPLGPHVYIRKAHGTPGEEDGIFWNYKAGLMLRAIHAVELLIKKGLLDLPITRLDTINKAKAEILKQLERSTRRRGNMKEVLTSYKSGETNSETQPWVLLGLTRIDDHITGYSED